MTIQYEIQKRIKFNDTAIYTSATIFLLRVVKNNIMKIITFTIKNYNHYSLFYLK